MIANDWLRRRDMCVCMCVNHEIGNVFLQVTISSYCLAVIWLLN